MKELWQALILSLVALTTSVASAAVVHIVEEGKLTGANGVVIRGVSYDVRFLDGTCVALFGGCDQASDFLFTMGFEPWEASAALGNQVFVDTAMGMFDSAPDLTRGCEDALLCDALTVYRIDSLPDTFYAAARNQGPDGTDLTAFGTIDPNHDIVDRTDLTFAVWSQSPVTLPEPSTLLLAAVALGFLAYRRRVG